MKMIEVDEHRGAYEDTTCWYKVTGCEGKTDEEIKKFVDWHNEGDWNCCLPYDIKYKRVSNEEATFTRICPFCD